MGLIFYVIYCVAVVVPFWRLLPRYGVSSYWSVLAVFPLLALGLLWLIAFDDKIKMGKDS